MNASTNASEISPTERIRTLADILSGRITAQEGAHRHDLPVRVVRQWLREIPVAAPTNPADPADPADQVDLASGEETAPARAGRRPLPRCRVVVDEMVQGLGL
ncbi:hypothetical protein PV755_35930 [Streptomyces caniscabiei]|uniref:Helix-turn-helix domain-containing protein n=1 Tax=Streptomyces caniscabiei TaxID=2746961 RepID=A0A927KZK8_9ACTN|nr:hypothetical protein [Streptomyces caniscabiei]MBD9722313.1 hypothetical protein [Streptomyces caniscabiei]MDX3514236.1 hypothetical protein [Streptomyces caniscabiei]MDX3716738.1 hypothetical protein [Streptomyces caniscabiei]WEO22620.1 hypothetical protein IHE65_05395 [Streptomyces caniscabiei]